MLIKEAKKNQKVFKLFKRDIIIKGKKYKYTIEEWSNMFSSQNGLCFGIWATYGTNNKKDFKKLFLN
jgi:hypothetical protein